MSESKWNQALSEICEIVSSLKKVLSADNDFSNYSVWRMDSVLEIQKKKKKKGQMSTEGTAASWIRKVIVWIMS